MSCQNNVGSVPSTHYRNYDYASHHVDPFGAGNISGRHSPIDAFCDEPQSDKEPLLGYGTNSVPESTEKHMAAMEAQLAEINIEQKLKQEPSPDGAGHTKIG